MVGFLGAALPYVGAGLTALRVGAPKLAQRYAPGLVNYGRGLLGVSPKVPPLPNVPTMGATSNISNRMLNLPQLGATSNISNRMLNLPQLGATSPVNTSGYISRLRNPFLTAEGKINKKRVGLAGLAGGAVLNEQLGFPVAEKFITGGTGEPPQPDSVAPAVEDTVTQGEETVSDTAGSGDDSRSGFLSRIGNAFSDSDRLARIAFGAALLEGQPIAEAAALSEYIRSGGAVAGGDLDTVVIDNETGEPVAYGNKGDASIKAYAKNTKAYTITSANSYYNREGDKMLQQMAYRQKEGEGKLTKDYEKMEVAINNRDLVNSLISALKSGDLTTGAYAETKTRIAKLLNRSDKVADEELLKAFNTELTLGVASTVAGALSENEFDNFSESQPGLSRGTEANIKLLERKVTLLDIAEAKIAYISDGLDEGDKYVDAAQEFDEKFKNDLNFKSKVLGASLINDVDAVLNGTVQLEDGERYYVNDVTSPNFGTYLQN
jgi:hypothetical protein